MKHQTKSVAILLNTSWYIYNFRKNLIKSLISNGIYVYTIAPYDDYTEKLVELGCEHHNIEFDSKSKNLFLDISFMFRLRKKLNSINPDLLLNFTIKPNVYGSIVARSLGIPCINNVAGFGTLFSENSVSKLFFKALFRISQRNALVVFFQNPDDYRELTRKNIVNRNVSQLLPGSGVDLDEFGFVPPQNNESIAFLLIARMIFPKGIRELVQAAQILKSKGYNNYKINLLGELGVNNPLAIHENEMDEFCNNDYIFYLGKTDDVKSEIEKSDVVVLPSYYREGTPKSLLEALAVGRPIITTNMPGCKETVKNGINGFICEPGSADDLALKMEKILLLNHSERLKMGLESRILAEEKYNEKIVINKYLKVIQGCKL